MVYILKLCTCSILIILIFSNCKKYLDQKPDKHLVIPSNVKDLQALLDNFRKLNQNDPSGGEISCDNYYLTTADWNSLYEDDMRKLYIWQHDHIFSPLNNMWNNVYQSVYIPNVVLDNLPFIQKTISNQTDFDNIKGQALFFRASKFHLIACTWALAYDSLTSKTDLGIPLRLTSDFNTLSKRGNLQSSYDQIVADLNDAISLLPVKPLSVYRPSKPAAYGLLARVYLSMRKYDLAEKYSDSCLQLYNTLIDYNTLNAEVSNPISSLNAETMMYSIARSWGPLDNSVAKVDSVLYSTYDSNDLRKTVFFKRNNDGTYGLKGNYAGQPSSELTGPTTNEVYLMRAECFARAGNVKAALDDLNTLLNKRWKTGTFISFIAENKSDALSLILKERRKELLYREIRWMDIKRLNKEGANIILKRIIEGQTFTLLPNDVRYALPIPEDVIKITGMKQNPR